MLGCGHDPKLTDDSPVKPGELFQVAQSGKGNRYLFIIDCSGSMNRDQRMGLAKREIVTSLRAIKPEKKFFIYYQEKNQL